jgi:hypothetical protein
MNWFISPWNLFRLSLNNWLAFAKDSKICMRNESKPNPGNDLSKGIYSSKTPGEFATIAANIESMET